MPSQRKLAACSPACGVFDERANAEQPPIRRHVDDTTAPAFADDVLAVAVDRWSARLASTRDYEGMEELDVRFRYLAVGGSDVGLPAYVRRYDKFQQQGGRDVKRI